MLPSRLNHTVYFALILIAIPAIAACSGRLAASPVVITPDESVRLQVVFTPTASMPLPSFTLTVQETVPSTPTPTLTSTATITAPAPDFTPTPALEPTLTDRVEWSEAGRYMGEERQVCGPVAGTHFAEDSRGQPTFLNIGEDYPSSKRFVVLIWGEDRHNFPSAPEDYYEGKTICASGEIQEYEGVFEIEIRSPEQIEIQQSSS
jgi:hypothetical protein